MSGYVLAGGLLALIVFLMLKPWLKVMVAFIIMSQSFDLTPSIMYGTLVWDFGAVLLLIASIQLLFQEKLETVNYSSVGIVLVIFTGWLLLCLIYSIVVYDYPIMDTLKTSRHWIIGYLSIFIFLRLFSVDPDALSKLLKWLYFITYVLLVVAVIQYLTGHQMLRGLYREYDGALRYLPIYLPVVLLFLWHILARHLSGEPVKHHEYLYAGLVVMVTAFTYTRGIYFSVLLMFSIMLFFLVKDKKIKIGRSTVFVATVILGVMIVMSWGMADRVVSRAASAIEIILSDKSPNAQVDRDTFAGRIMTAKERVSLVAEYNPIIGYGFIHEDNVPASIRNKLKHGSVIYSAEMVERYRLGYPYVLALYSADIGWGNIAVVSGLVGLAIFIVFVAVFSVSYREMRFLDGSAYYLSLAFYLVTIALLVLMFISNTFTNQIQIPALMIAGYLYVRSRTRERMIDGSVPDKLKEEVS